MAHRHRDADFAIAVEGAFVAPKIWFIHAAVEYVPYPGRDACQHIRPAARIELMRGVFAESRRGWDLGASSVRVYVEGDREVAGLFEVLGHTSAPAVVA